MNHSVIMQIVSNGETEQNKQDFSVNIVHHILHQK